MYCKNCGTFIDDDSTFCFNCGHRVQKETFILPKIEKRSLPINKKAIRWSLLCLSILAFLCIFVVVSTNIATELSKDPGYYNGLVWETSYAELKNVLAEENITNETETELTTKSKTFGDYSNVSVYENYLFNDSKLYGVECDIFIPRGNPTTSLEIVKEITDKYEEVYGETQKDVKGYHWETSKSEISVKAQKESVHIFFFQSDTSDEQKNQLKYFKLDNYEGETKVQQGGVSRSNRISTRSSTSYSTPQTSNRGNVSTEYENALSKGLQYANYLHMSKKAIYNQLTSSYGEGFSSDAAQYAVDHMTGVDWNYNALQKAKEYQTGLSMSKSEIYNQLTSSYGEQFTASQAQYAIDHLN